MSSRAEKGKYSHEFIVYYWQNDGFMSRNTGGHLAAKMHGTGYTGGGKANSTFINWAPAARSEGGNVHRTAPQAKHLDPASFSAVGKHSQSRFTYAADKVAMGVEANVKVTIPGQKATGFFGLDTDLIHEWWLVFKQSCDSNWSMVLRNCSSVVAKAMLVGGAGTYATPPPTNVWTPESVCKWSREVAETVNRMNATIGLRSSKTAYSAKNRPEAKRAPFSPEAFRKMTSGGALTRRPSSLRAVDQSLTAFHNVTTSLNRDVLGKKIAAAVDVLAALHEYLAAHPADGDSPALILGSQLLNFLDEARAKIAEIDRLEAQDKATSQILMADDSDLLKSWNYHKMGKAPDHGVRLANDAGYAMWWHLQEFPSHKNPPPMCMQCQVLRLTIQQNG